MTTEEKIAEILLNIKAVSLNAKKPYRWVSGILAPIYTDCRLIMSHPKERRIVIEEMEKLIEEEISRDMIDVIAGVATSGIPHAAWLAEKLDKPLIYARKEKKDHGKENLIEGKLKKGQKIILIEDLVSTGGSSVSSIHAIRLGGGILDHQISIFTYELEKSKINFKDLKVKAFPLTNFSTLVKVAVDKGYLKQGEKKLVLAWKEDPENWGKI
ncbi:MAG: orotate phosphoribosyltransferase [Candidatus Aenigmarchaeota archaeon]|nr:orotate phosphoribosyltransferase [Candidatus Aenigmarchaeota archaeon]